MKNHLYDIYLELQRLTQDVRALVYKALLILWVILGPLSIVALMIGVEGHLGLSIILSSFLSVMITAFIFFTFDYALNFKQYQKGEREQDLADSFEE